MLKRIEVTDPPKMAPMYRPDRKIRPVCGASLKTTGSRRAAPWVGPRAGITPMMVPVMTPAMPAMMFTGWVATPSPNSRSCSVPDIAALPEVSPRSSEDRDDAVNPARQQDPQHAREHLEAAERN